MAGAPDPTVLHPVAGQDRVVYLRPLVTDPRIEVGEYTYAIVGGNPARVLRRRYEDDDAKRLLRAAW